VAGAAIIDSAIEQVADKNSLYLNEAKKLTLYHHERWDGKGYPCGIKSEEIPLSARVMAVADVFDALVSRRSYKPGFPIEKALGIIREESGTHFDPTVAEAFLECEEEARAIAESANNQNAKAY
jgi:energy-coupling factor transport system substrate-specific component